MFTWVWAFRRGSFSTKILLRSGRTRRRAVAGFRFLRENHTSVLNPAAKEPLRARHIPNA